MIANQAELIGDANEHFVYAKGFGCVSISPNWSPLETSEESGNAVSKMMEMFLFKRSCLSRWQDLRPWIPGRHTSRSMMLD